MSKKNSAMILANTFPRSLPDRAATKASDAWPFEVAYRSWQAHCEHVTRGAQALEFGDKEAAPQAALLAEGHSKGPQI